MQELKDRIVKEGKVLPGNIIKVDGFLNHRIDTELMDHIAEEFGKHFPFLISIYIIYFRHIYSR